MNGNERRRMELIHPEIFLTSYQIEENKYIAKDLFMICNTICMAIMILFAMVVVFISAKYMGTRGLYIAFFGIIFDIILGMIIAYNLGNRMQIFISKQKLKQYTED